MEPMLLLNNHADQVTALAFSDDGSLLASADSADQIRVWDFDSSTVLHVLEGSQTELQCLSFRSDGERLASAGSCLVHLWDPKAGKPLAGSDVQRAAHTRLAMSPSGDQFACNGGGKRARVWNSNGQSALTLEEAQPVHGLAWSPNGQWIAGAARSPHSSFGTDPMGKPGSH